MGVGYTRNDTSNNIANGNVIDAADLDGEFDALVAAFANGTGHTHDGTTAEGGAITVFGPAQEYVGDGTALYPKTDATYDLGKTASSFNVAYIESINLGGTAITATAAELNYTDGVTSAIQTQLDNKQPLDVGLTSIAGLTTAADRMIYTTGVDTYAVTTLTAAGRALIDDASASAQRTTLGLGTIATQASSSVSITGGSITGITDIAVADGGTGASTAAGARTNLGLVIGTNVQAYDADLSTIAALASTDGNFIVGSALGWVVESGATARTSLGLGSIATQASSSVSITGGSISGITDLAVADGGTGSSTAAGARTNLGLAIGSNVQAYDAGLTSIAGLTTAADRMIYTTASDTYSVATLTAAGRALIDDASASAQRTTLGLGSIATQAASSVSITGGTISGLTSLGVSGNITVTGTVDGRDVATDGTKLDGIATGAEVNQNAFSNIAVSGQTTVAADAKTDTLTLAAGTNITLTTNATTDTVTIAASGGAPSTADVLSATAGATAGDVGTYAFLQASTASDYNFGTTLAGSNLKPFSVSSTASPGTTFRGVTQNSARSGTWRCMGFSDYNTTGGRTPTIHYGATLWLRIS